jgi:Flp pilus assembly protein TadD
MRSPPSHLRNFLASTSLVAVIAMTTTGCQTIDATGSSGALAGAFKKSSAPVSESDWQREAAVTTERYNANPRDAAVALRHAEALRKSGQRAQAAAVLQQASIAHPADRRILGAYGRALADTGNLEQALEVLARAHSPDQPDWRILSAQGAVLDQMGRHEDARRYYETALKMVPDEPSVLSNLGLSYALAQDLQKAEDILRKANARAGSDRRVRQNFALVIGLRGRFQEAEEIARADLPADEAAANIAYLRQMLAEHAEKSADRPRAPRKLSAAL